MTTLQFKSFLEHVLYKGVDRLHNKLYWEGDRYYFAPTAYSWGAWFDMAAKMNGAKPVVRFDHPGRTLVEKYFSKKLLWEKRMEV